MFGWSVGLPDRPVGCAVDHSGAQSGMFQGLAYGNR